jgi:hypothetical protein
MFADFVCKAAFTCFIGLHIEDFHNRCRLVTKEVVYMPEFAFLLS